MFVTKKESNRKEKINANARDFYISFTVIAAITITCTVLVSLIIDKMRTIENCNIETCASDGCVQRYCSNGECISNRVAGCCDDEQCEDVERTYFNSDVMHVSSIKTEPNSTFGTLVNGALFRNGSVAGKCLVTDGICSDSLGPSTIDSITVDFLNSSSGCLDIGDFISICNQGDIIISNGTLIPTHVNVSRALCLREALPLNGDAISINGISLLRNQINATRAVITGQVNVSQIAVALNVDQVILSGVKIANNSAQGFVGDVNGPLRLNPHGGNIGFGILGNNINDALFPAHVGGSLYANQIIFTESSSTNNGTEVSFNTARKEFVQLTFRGPWSSSFTSRISVMRLGNLVSMSITDNLVRNCSALNTSSITSTTAIPTTYFPTGKRDIDTRVRVISNSNDVAGVMKISNGIIIISSTNLDANGDGYINGTVSQLCGVYKASISWIL